MNQDVLDLPFGRQITKQQALTRIRNEQIMFKTRAEIDLVSITRLKLAEPNNKELDKQARQLKRQVELREQVISVIDDKLKE